MVNNTTASLDLLFHALSDLTRRDIVDVLRRGPLRVTDLAKPYKMSLPAVSKHLKVLQAAGLLERNQQGREHILSLNVEALNAAFHWLRAEEAGPKTFFDSKISFEPVDPILL